MGSAVAATKRIEFDAAHRVLGHKGKCRHLHGHRYAAEISIASVKGINELGMVVDFADVKELIGKWIDDNWDHNIILNADDPLLTVLEKVSTKDKRSVLQDRLPYIMPKGLNPTAEVMAEHLRDIADGLLPAGLEVVQIRLYETPSSFADSVPLNV